MFEQINASAYFALRPVLVTLYLLWGVLWGMVAYHYGRASYVSWLTQGRGFRWMLADIVDPFWWALKRTWCRLPLIRNKTYCAMEEVPSPYSPGHLLRFAIFLGSLSPFAFGLTLHNVDRSTWTPTELGISLFFVATSIFAAGGHLFLAFRRSPTSWERLVVFGLIWLLVGPWLVHWFY